MKRCVVFGLFLVAVTGLALGNISVSNNAETSPPDPKGIIAYK